MRTGVEARSAMSEVVSRTDNAHGVNETLLENALMEAERYEGSGGGWDSAFG